MARRKEKNRESTMGYLEENPVVSFHVPKEEKEKLVEIAQKNDRSVKDIAREALRLYVNEEAISYNRGYTEGFNEGKKIGINKGFVEGKDKYGISMPCNVCGEACFIIGDTLKEQVQEAFQDAIWGHKKCFDKEKYKI